MAELAMWLTDSGRLNRKVVTHPASSLAQDRESLPAETSVLTTMLRCQPFPCNRVKSCVDIGDGFSVEIVNDFCYLGDMLSVDGDTDAAVTATGSLTSFLTAKDVSLLL